MSERHVILIVDDTPENLQVLGDMLEQEGNEVLIATNGHEALENAKATPHPDLILLDIMMPDMDGYEVCRRLKADPELRLIPVIFISALGLAEQKIQAFRAGGVDYITKPFHAEEVVARVHTHLTLTHVERLKGEIAKRQRAEDESACLQANAKEELHNYFIRLEETIRLRTQELHEAQSAMESVFQNIPDGILSVNKEMVVSHINDKCAKNLDAAPGTTFQGNGTIFQDECCNLLKRTVHTQEAITDYRIEIVKDEKTTQVFLVSTSLLKDKSAQMAGALLIIHDITRLADLENQLQERRRFRQMVGKCPQVQEVYNKVRKLASIDTTVLITGESGTGKEILVETLHASGNRSAKPLIRVNCAALPENLLESELFGHIRGAFTGAVKDRPGRIQAAEGGILFLDEIGDISPRTQLKLLRFLESKEYERVGESLTRRADVRVFAATNADLTQKVQEKLFREDLYYRLKVMVIHLPPLRERRDDIPFLIDHFLSFFNRKFHKSIAGISKEFLDILWRYDWPGNIRELKHVLEHAVILSSGHELKPESLPKDLLAAGSPPSQDDRSARNLTREDLLNALKQAGGNKAKSARILKLGRTTLYNKIKEFNLQHESDT